ncbi:inosine triphosphate pyrophosphatase [Pseudovirgaria hyperparasitica]|uniref:Inosine triphosphate pyrophosphatase n=1 Tax=Pseudovirgaria hyperparasitica TaxID=470096 RepID=A0A6A6VZW8_9PEZI|nr:inosine triphosphate pyrophosphatase [Pseudovirgaria hyperparasitica]KAF2756192.1 inosine triphosphate pyrophosphatase [Pseudovirgaria hyperparasitica]
MAPTAPTHLYFITGNANKLAEVQAILDGVIELRSKNVDLVEIQGTAEEVTIDKARRAAAAVGEPVLVEDTCLCFKAMNGLPGPYMYEHFATAITSLCLTYLRKWFMKSLGPHGLHKMLAGFDDKSATAVCNFAYCEGPDHEPILFQGKTEGRLVESRGPTVFGWDSAFEVGGQTYAEMEKKDKHAISHRGRALDKLKEWLAQASDA